MKKLLKGICIMSLFLITKSAAACDCSGFSKSVTMGNEGVLSYAQIAVDMLSEDGCGREYEGGDLWEYVIINGSTSVYLPGLTSTVYGPWNGFIGSYGEEVMDLQILTDFLATSGVVAYKAKFNFDFSVPSNFGCGYLQGDYEDYHIYATVYVGTEKVLNIPTLCSGMEYQYSEVLSNHQSWPASAPGYTSQVLTTNDGQSFSGLTITFQQVPSNTVSLVWKGTTLDGYVVKRTWNKNMFEAGMISWNSTPQGLSIQSPNVPLVNHLTYTSLQNYILEGTGNGVLLTTGPGGQWVFNPSIAGDGTTVINVRVDHNGCKSRWQDTTFYVTPIVQYVAAPTLNLIQTFGAGEFGINAKTDYPTTFTGTFPNTQILYGGTATIGKFHFICEGDIKQYYIYNPNPNLSYDWFTLHNGVLDSIGSGVSKTIQMPTNPGINISQSLNPNPFPILTDDMPFYLELPGGYSVYGGELFTILVRGRNIIGQTSGFQKVFLGIVPKPVIAPFPTVCFDQGLELTIESANSSYLNFVPLNDFRSARWNTDTDAQWELFGDTISYSTGNTNKVTFYEGQLVDTTKMYAWTGSGYEIKLAPSADIMCYSSIETIPVVRKPSPIVSFNQTGITDIGTLVLGIVTGSYFDSATDSITWNWSDDANFWNNDSCWHYMNDLGTVGVEILVEDEYGCIGTSGSLYSNNWYVPGTLNYEEESLADFSAYPNPATTSLTIVGWLNSDIDVYDPSGKIVKSFRVDSDNYELSVEGLPHYSLLVNKTRGTFFKLLVNN